MRRFYHSSTFQTLSSAANIKSFFSAEEGNVSIHENFLVLVVSASLVYEYKIDYSGLT